MTRRKPMKKQRVDRRLHPHFLRNRWNEFAPDPKRRARFCRELQRLAPEATVFSDYWTVCQAGVRADYSPRHARRLAEHRWVLEGTEEQEGSSG